MCVLLAQRNEHGSPEPVRNTTAQLVTRSGGDQLILNMLPVRNTTAVIT